GRGHNELLPWPTTRSLLDQHGGEQRCSPTVIVHVRIIRGIADLIARPLPHNTERAFLRHRTPFLLFRTSRDAATQGRERGHMRTPKYRQPRHTAWPLWSGAGWLVTGMMRASIALRGEQKKSCRAWGAHKR